MESNLLDSESADTSLANEWSLPVLPEGSLSHPSSSQELADIFGTSDDEEDADFPFGLSSDLPVPKGFEEITLPEGSNKSFGGSLLSGEDSELFLTGFHSSQQPPQAEALEVIREDDKDSAGSKELGEEVNSTVDHIDGVKEVSPSSVVRKSARLRARQSSSGSEQEVRKSATELKESQVERVDTESQTKTVTSEGGSTESGEDDSEEDDPNKLYCICQQPHDDRFMICCDSCEEWFHGTCVGISVAQGKRMEREGKEYVCPVCTEKLHKDKEESAASRSARQQQREIARERVIKKKLAASGDTPTRHAQRRRTLSATHPPTTPSESDAYGLSQLFLPDNAPRGGEVSSTSELEGSVVNSDVKPQSHELLSHKCVTQDCPNKTTPPSVYCSRQCIVKHVTASLKKLASRGVTVQSSPSEFVKGSGGVAVIDKATNKALVGICAPSEKELIPWLQAHPSYQVLVHGKGAPKGKTKSSKLKLEVKKEESKHPKIALMDPDSVRANAKRALYQILWKRCEEAPDMSGLTQADVENIAHDIEEKLFNLHQDINPKYKNKYRSLIFNLKDTKNQGLFRKVLHKEVSSRDLVRMSTEKLASDDLAAWRESTLKKNIEMIKMREEEAGALGEVIRKVTHKGEVEIDSSELGEKITQNVSTLDIPHPVELESNFKPKSKPQSDSKTPDSSTRKEGGGILALLANTTSQHGSHLYDQHCDICTGKVAPPTSSPPASPDSRMEDVGMAVEHTSPDSVAKLMSPQPSANKVVWKGFVSMVGLTKFASTAYPVSGFSEDLLQILPGTLHVMGRIAYAQVWDYLDKLRSSGTRDIAVIHFGWLEEEKDAYISMFNYLVRKHRSGVISSGHRGIKDMYLVPLPGLWDVPQQLLPFTGPGLPLNRGDLMLGVIVRSKSKKHSQHLNDLSPGTRIRAEVTLKRHHSHTEEGNFEGFEKKRTKLEVGLGSQTPPLRSSERAETSGARSDPMDDDSAPYSPSNTLEGSSFDDTLNSTAGGPVNTEGPKTMLKSVQMSFYGEHRPPKSVTLPAPPPVTGMKSAEESSKPTDVNTSAMASSLRTTLNLHPSTNVQNILANLSSAKLKELASAVSNLEKISDGPIDQSTLAAAGTVNIQATFSPGAQISSSAPVSAARSVTPVVPQAPVSQPPLQDHPQPSQQQFSAPIQDHQAPDAHTHPVQDSHTHQAQPQYHAGHHQMWHDRPSPSQQYHPQAPNYQSQDYHRSTEHPYPPIHNESSFHPPHRDQYPEQGWRDPRWDQHYQLDPPHHDFEGRSRFHDRGRRGFRGEFRGRKYHDGRRDPWRDDGQRLEHEDRYGVYHM